MMSMTTTLTKEEMIQNLPPRYYKYSKIFAEELETGLPEHSEWDHKIHLKPGTQPKFIPIYNLNENQLKELWEYI